MACFSVSRVIKILTIMVLCMYELRYCLFFFIYRGAISYVSCCYTVVSIILVFLLFIQQIILISQNITIQEFNRSIQRRSAAAGEHVSWWRSLYISDNPYNMSLRSNWLTFIRRTRHEPIVPSANEEDLIE